MREKNTKKTIKISIKIIAAFLGTWGSYLIATSSQATDPNVWGIGDYGFMLMIEPVVFNKGVWLIWISLAIFIIGAILSDIID